MYDPDMVQIMPMTPGDTRAVLEIERSSQLEPWTEQCFHEEMNRAHSRMLVARIPAIAEEPLGYMCFWQVADEIQILNLAVHPDRRGRGLGRVLLHHALKAGCEREARIAVLEVRRSNLTAQRLYAGAGFQPVGERPNYYGGLCESAVVMELDMIRYCRNDIRGTIDEHSVSG